MSDCGFEELEHTADWALEVWGTGPAALFRCAAEGMLALLNARGIGGTGTRTEIELHADDLESLLVCWLEELLYRLESEMVTFSDIDLEIHPGPRLTAQIEEVSRAPIHKQIKAVTFHDLEIRSTSNGLETIIVFDV